MRFSVTSLAAVVLGSFVVLSASSAHADTLHLASTSPTVVNGSYIYPYSFNVDGSNQLTNLMCLDYTREVTNGETWNVNITGIPTDSSATSVGYREAAYAFSTLGQNSTTVVQYAAWSIFDPSISYNGLNSTQVSQVQSLLQAASGAAQNQTLLASGFFNGFSLYLPTSDQTGWTDGPPQRFIGIAQTPEPASFVLLGSGLLGAAGAIRRRLQR